MDLSIVIPAFCEGEKVGHDVEAAGRFFIEHGLEGEIIVVDDGSPDNTTQAAEHAVLPPGIERHVIRYQPNRGKGYALRTGISLTRGEYVMFADAGQCIPLENALRGIEAIRSGEYEIAHGSRKLPESVLERRQRPYRRALSWLFRKVIGTLMGVPGQLTDTQCGFKVYRGDVARELYAACRTDGFMFDIEILLRALRKGYRVTEFPVEWRCDWDSRLSPARGAGHTFKELQQIRRHLQEEEAP